MSERYDVSPVGRVESPLSCRSEAPKQGDEGAPEAWLVLDKAFAEAAADLEVGSRYVVLTWLHEAARDVLVGHPRGDVARRAVGIFSTRSPDRPNPIGLHTVQVLDRSPDGLRLRVGNLEAIDGTPILDIKPMLGPVETR
jgi:tRNA-Thr(GGU) m(6)t(6)A37 methyltransferase TsaA